MASPVSVRGESPEMESVCVRESVCEGCDVIDEYTLVTISPNQVDDYATNLKDYTKWIQL